MWSEGKRDDGSDFSARMSACAGTGTGSVSDSFSTRVSPAREEAGGRGGGGWGGCLVDHVEGGEASPVAGEEDVVEAAYSSSEVSRRLEAALSEARCGRGGLETCR